MQFTPRDLRAIELAKRNERDDLEENLKEYHTFIDTLICLHETLAENKTPVKHWEKYSEPLLLKFCFHGLTLHNILSGLTLKSQYYDKEISGKKIIDIASAKVIFRSQIEAFLMFHHIYVNPKDEDEKELRYYAWIYSSLLQRQSFPITTNFAKEQKLKDKEQLKLIEANIRGLQSFKKLTEKQQKSLFETGSGKLFYHWAKILKETGYAEDHTFNILYTFLSIYSHSEGLSVIQLNDKNLSFHKKHPDANLDVYHSKLFVVLMIMAIRKLYEPVETKFSTLPMDLQHDIELYWQIAKSLKKKSSS